MKRSGAIALSSYPLSSKFKSLFEDMIGIKVDYVSTAELRTLSLWGIVRYLRNIKHETFYIPLEDINSKAILPILLILSGISSVRKIEVVYPNLYKERVAKWKIVIQISQLLFASMASGVAAYRCRRETARLLKQPRVEIRLG